MGNDSSRTLELTELYTPSKTANYLKDSGICQTQTTVIIPSINEKGKMVKKPSWSWYNSQRINYYDTALMIMTGDVLVIDIDDRVDDINRYLNLPDNCWIDYTPSGGCHIYLNKDDDIYEYCTTIGLKLWGFEHVDILIKNGFAYAGGTNYRHPVNGTNMLYVWDNERNPSTVRKLCNIPIEWKEEILKKLEKASKEFVSNITPWILGCNGTDGICHGCCGFKPTKDIEYSFMLLKKLLDNKKRGKEILAKWLIKYNNTSIKNSHYMINTCDPYDNRLLEFVKKESTHTKMYRINEFVGREFKDYTKFMTNRGKYSRILNYLLDNKADASLIKEFRDLVSY